MRSPKNDMLNSAWTQGARFESRDKGDFAARVNAALRAQFGGHAVKTKA